MRRFGLLLLVSACGGDDQPAGPDAGPLVWSACAPGTRVGGFEIELAEAFTGVNGQVFDAVTPAELLDTIATDGDCRMARAPVFFCDPACTPSSETCNAAGECVPRAVAASVGTVTVTGMAVDVTMEPLSVGSFYTNPGSLPHPGFAPGADILLSAAGGTWEPFTLRGWGVSPLVVGFSEVVVQAGSQVDLTWTALATPGPTRLRILLIVNGHGVTGTRIECETDDDGAFTIPEPLITMLVNDGLSGFPTIALTRMTSDSVTITPGCVELRVQAALTDIPVSIPGLISCVEDNECPMGQTCQSDLTCG